MTIKHYPSIELCKKLTEIGFPETERDYVANELNGVIGHHIGKDGYLPGDYVCPSVMEMLDVIYIPLHNRISIDKMFDIDDGVWYKVSFYSSEHFNDLIRGFQGTLPNALAEMILWLHEKNYISFSK